MKKLLVLSVALTGLVTVFLLLETETAMAVTGELTEEVVEEVLESEVAEVDGAPVQATVCGNTVAVNGDTSASCSGNNQSGSGGDSPGTADADTPPVQATVCGNSVAVDGAASASCQGDNTSRDSGDDAVVEADGSAIQVIVCGNSVSALDGNAEAGVHRPKHHHW